MNARKEKALTALLLTKTKEEAAKAAGISRRCLYEYLSDEEFRKEYRKKCNSLLEDGTLKMQKAVDTAVATLESVMKSENQYAKVNAARVILEYAIKYTEQVDIEYRLSKLEEERGNKE